MILNDKITLGQCIDTDNGVFDYAGDSCHSYKSNPENCGKFDLNDFKAKTLCCGCKVNGK